MKQTCVYVIATNIDGSYVYCNQPVYLNSACCEKHHKEIMAKADKLGPRA